MIKQNNHTNMWGGALNPTLGNGLKLSIQLGGF